MAIRGYRLISRTHFIVHCSGVYVYEMSRVSIFQLLESFDIYYSKPFEEKMTKIQIFPFYRESEQKHLPPKNMCHEPHVAMEKSQTFSTGTILYPQHTNEQALQQELHKESRLLWATLTPHGTRHFISPAGEYANYEDHYEVVDYRVKPVKTTPKKIPIKVKKIGSTAKSDLLEIRLFFWIRRKYNVCLPFFVNIYSHSITAASAISITKTCI